MALDLTRVTSEVGEMTNAALAAEALLDNLATQLREHANDPAAITAIADQLDSAGTQLAAAVVRNTPAEQPPTP